MQFAHSQYLYLLWLVPLLVLFFGWTFRQRALALLRFADKPLLEKLVVNSSKPKQRLKALLLVLFVTFAVLALARPQWGTRMETVRRSGIDILIVLDSSLSMDTRDVAPTRLEKAKHEIQLLLGDLKGNRAGLLLFAGMPIVNCPLTIDQNAVKMFLEIVDTHAVPKPGTDIGAAIRLGLGSFNQKERRHKLMLLVTDGENLEGDPVQAAAEAKKDGVMIYTLGIGSGSGEPIPLRDEKENITGYKKDEAGNVIVSRLDEATLEQIASTTGGKYFRSTPGEEEVSKIAGEIAGMDRKEFQSKVYLTLLDRFQYPLGLALLFIFLEMVLSIQKKT
jgi:Ca-activated chloride channel homolog